ncbi:transmembrane protein, putative (macronuclear) [Tetrahymena thermophila SB210]|uniref:Transmembrane protein, putative n=1 Tax=Tetrahymena thermophila (strain SB210) TaxID=312017 RepID=W7X6D5_TETTS|nr:transmembrane protein, putative [Tetrahymena thermophila SB210]EWS74945.1 transmembrane protein, putative [Tetrahymena thermophila SB210]|eukprot:XP_012652534.1 transmembrane protein, putative [Tetrahymena thermophila SB210]
MKTIQNYPLKNKDKHQYDIYVNEQETLASQNTSFEDEKSLNLNQRMQRKQDLVYLIKSKIYELVVKILLHIYFLQNFFLQVALFYLNIQYFNQNLLMFTFIYIIPTFYLYNKLLNEKGCFYKEKQLQQIILVVLGFKQIQDYNKKLITINYQLIIYLISLYQSILLMFMQLIIKDVIFSIFLAFLVILNTHILLNVFYEDTHRPFEDFILKYSKILLKNFIHCIAQVSYYIFCFLQMTVDQIIIIFLIKFILIFAFACYNKSSFLGLTFFGIIIDRKVIQKNISMNNFILFMVKNVACFSRYFKVQYFYLLLLRTLQVFFIYIFRLEDLSSIYDNYELLIMPAISYLLIIFQSYQEIRKLQFNKKEVVEIESQYDFLNLVQNEQKYTNLKQIFITSNVDQNQILSFLMYNFKQCAIFLEETSNNQEVMFYHQRYFLKNSYQKIVFEYISLPKLNNILLAENIVPNVREITIKMKPEINTNKICLSQFYSKLLNTIIPIKVTLKKLIPKKIKKHQLVYNNYFCQSSQVIAHCAVFNNQISQYLINNPQQIMYDLYEDSL